MAGHSTMAACAICTYALHAPLCADVYICAQRRRCINACAGQRLGERLRADACAEVPAHAQGLSAKRACTCLQQPGTRLKAFADACAQAPMHAPMCTYVRRGVDASAHVPSSSAACETCRAGAACCS
mmetsp:Transcript_12408/g.36340  ORF Transcript_12408/g.36340 Transcript_12408/m.36340 type:complete len:127 (+) Transcript_12408:326-706(+)